MLNLDKLLKQEMDRKQFLKLLGIGFISIFGVSTFLKTIADHHVISEQKSNASASNGYGATNYGL